VFDHTSTLQFLEQWTGVMCPNISPWRRQVCGDFTSAFDFAHPDFSYPGASFTDLSVINCPSGTTVSPPLTQTDPTQEAGTLTHLPAPYQPNAFCTLNSSTLTVTMTNSGAASVHFGVYANLNTSTPQQFDVPQGTSAAASNLATTSGNYDFSCYGPDGFQRRFAGNLASDYNKIEVVSTINPTNGAFAILFENLSTSSKTFSVSNGYTGLSANYAVAAHTTNSLNIGSETNNGLYDVTVTSTADSLFLRRFLGRAEIAPVVVPPPPIVIGNPSVVSGKFQFNFTGPVGESYKVLVTTNVPDTSSWQLASYGIFGNSAGTFTETNSLSSQQTRFYRMVSP
jgi:phospholipase C